MTYIKNERNKQRKNEINKEREEGRKDEIKK